MKIEDSISVLAMQVSEKAQETDTPFVDKIDAFKALTAFLALISKHKDRNLNQDDQEPTIEGFSKLLQNAEGPNGQCSED